MIAVVPSWRSMGKVKLMLVSGARTWSKVARENCVPSSWQARS